MTDEPQRRQAPPELLEECAYCQQPVLWLTLANGYRRTFNPYETTESSHHDAFMVRKRDRRAVPVDLLHTPPRWVVIQHRCTQYRLAREEERLRVGHALDGIVVRE